MCKLQTTLTHSLTRSDRWIEKTWTGMEWSGGEKQLYKAINRMKSLFMKFATMNSNHIILYSILAASVTHTHTHAKSQKHCRWIINGVEWPIQSESIRRTAFCMAKISILNSPKRAILSIFIEMTQRRKEIRWWWSIDWTVVNEHAFKRHNSTTINGSS